MDVGGILNKVNPKLAVTELYVASSCCKICDSPFLIVVAINPGIPASLTSEYDLEIIFYRCVHFSKL